MSFRVSTGPVSLAASTTKTLLDLATPSTGVGRVFKWWVGADATSAGTATSDLRIQVGLFNAAVTTHTAYTPYNYDGADNGVNSAITAGIATTVEGAGVPTGGANATGIEEHLLGLTQSELLIWETALILIPASSFFRIRIISPANIGTTNVYAGACWTE